MNENYKVAYVASECQPFFTSGGLGEVIGSLPKEIVKKDKGAWNVDVYLPLYSSLNKAYANKLVYVGNITVNLSWRKQYCGIYKYVQKNITYYFIDNEYYFKRDRLYGYFDDGERFAFFSKAVIDVMLYLDSIPNIIHCHDWQTGLVLVYLRTLYYSEKKFMDLKRIFTIHNIEYQGKYSLDTDIVEDVFGIDANDSYLLEYDGMLNIMKGAIECANKVTTVSPTYAKEILTPQYAHELEDEMIRAEEEGKLLGILNGIDYKFYDPSNDEALFEVYDKNDFLNKEKNKEELKNMLGLPKGKNIPLIGMVTRLVWHKGLDILKSCFDNLMNSNLQLIILGTGDSYYEGFLKDMEARYPNKLKVILTFNQDLARKIYAACDMFLMPSASEPCGLSQMIASRYGTIPVVRSTGGLHDSIIDFSKGGNGYVFEGFEGASLYKAVECAMEDYKNDDWNEKVKKVMNVDFSWSKSAKTYVEMYKNILEK